LETVFWTVRVRLGLVLVERGVGLVKQGNLSMFGVRGMANAQERALEYKKQLEEIVSPRLRRRLLNDIAEFDMAAKRLMKYD
jgi:hypothetical protein